MRRRAQYGLVGHSVKKLRNCSSVVVGIRGIRSVRSRLCVGRPGESGGKALDRPVVSYSYERQVGAMYITSRHKEGRGNASNVQLAEQDSLYTLDDSDDETQSRAAVGGARPRECELPKYLRREHGRNPVDWRINLETPRLDSTRHFTIIHSNHGHVARTGNDQAITTPGERMPRMPPHLHISRQTATAAVSGRCHCWFVYIQHNTSSKTTMC
jgi:hypothetical protein